jgi:hypothetical protein
MATLTRTNGVRQTRGILGRLTQPLYRARVHKIAATRKSTAERLSVAERN